jgi:hypothetical protein
MRFFNQTALSFASARGILLCHGQLFTKGPTQGHGHIKSKALYLGDIAAREFSAAVAADGIQVHEVCPAVLPSRSHVYIQLEAEIRLARRISPLCLALSYWIGAHL